METFILLRKIWILKLDDVKTYELSELDINKIYFTPIITFVLYLLQKIRYELNSIVLIEFETGLRTRDNPIVLHIRYFF